MSSWLLWLIGIHDVMTSEAASVSLHWSRPGFLLAGLLLTLPLGWWIYHRQRRNLPHIGMTPRTVMSLCRTLVFLLLMMVLAGPYVRLDEVLSQHPIIAVVHDVSASMDLQAGPFTPQEIESMHVLTSNRSSSSESKAWPDAERRRELHEMTRALVAMQTLKGPLRDLERNKLRNYEWRFYEVDRVIRQIQGETLDAIQSSFDQPALKDSQKETDGQETALGLALDHIYADTAGRRLGAILLLTDARNTVGPTPLSVLRRYLRTTNDTTPVIPISVGSAQPKADIAIADVLSPPQVTLGDSVAILATLSTVGYEGTRIDVELRHDEAILDRETVTLAGNRQQQQITLTYEPKEVGPAILQVVVKPQPDEQLEANNLRSFPVAVTTESLRMLYIEGYPRWDFRFLDHELRRDRGLDVKQVMESTLRAEGIPENELSAGGQLPMTQEAFAEFDIVMLGDISPSMLPPLLVEALSRAVREDGVGLIVQAGFRHMPHDFTGRRDAGLESLLPVTIESRGERADSGYTRGGELAPPFKPFSMKVTAAGSMDPAFHLFTNASRNRDLWSQMPVFFWAASSNRPKAGAIELARVITAEGEFPLIATHFAGRGRVLFIGTDSTYRWRRNIGSALFSRFWGQAIRHVARRQDQSPDRSAIAMYPPRVEPGELVTVELYAVDDSGQPLENESVDVTHLLPQSENSQANTQTLTLRRSGDGGYFRGSFEPQLAGQHTVLYRVHNAEETSAVVQVAGSQRELMFVDIDVSLLHEMAEASGGQVLLPNELDTLATLIDAKPTETRRILEEEVWDNWLMLVLLVGLYCADVGTRRVLGLT